MQGSYRFVEKRVLEQVLTTSVRKMAFGNYLHLFLIPVEFLSALTFLCLPVLLNHGSFFDLSPLLELL